MEDIYSKYKWVVLSSGGYAEDRQYEFFTKESYANQRYWELESKKMIPTKRPIHESDFKKLEEFVKNGQTNNIH